MLSKGALPSYLQHERAMLQRGLLATHQTRWTKRACKESLGEIPARSCVVAESHAISYLGFLVLRAGNPTAVLVFFASSLDGDGYRMQSARPE